MPSGMRFGVEDFRKGNIGPERFREMIHDVFVQVDLIPIWWTPIYAANANRSTFSGV